MTDLVERLSEEVRRQREEDARRVALEQFAAGEIDEAEARARLAGDEEALAALELFRPIGAEAEARIADAVLSARPALRVIDGGAPPRVAPAPRTDEPTGRSAPWLWMLVAAAAAVVVWFATTRDRGGLPDYRAELSGNVVDVRANGPAVTSSEVTLQRAAAFELTLRPERATQIALEVRLVLVRDGVPRAFSPAVDVSAQGAIHVGGPVATVFPDTSAPWEVVVLVGPAGSLPADPPSILARAADPRGARVLRVRVAFTP